MIIGITLSVTQPRGSGLSIFDLVVNGQPLIVNSQQLRATNGN